MTSKFNLIGLSRPKSITCSVIGGSEEIFWPKVEMSQDRFNALWEFYSGRTSGDKFTAIVQHDGLYEDGVPKNPVLKQIEV